MTGEKVVRVCRAVAKHLAALADDLEQITAAPKPDKVADARDDPGWGYGHGMTTAPA